MSWSHSPPRWGPGISPCPPHTRFLKEESRTSLSAEERFSERRKEDKRRSPEKRKERQSLKDRLGWKKEEVGKHQKKSGVKERLGKRRRVDCNGDNIEMSSQRSRSRSRSQLRNMNNRVGVRDRLGKRTDIKSLMERDKLESRQRSQSNSREETRIDEIVQVSQESEVVKLKHELNVLQQELAKNNQKQQFRDQSLQDEKELALRAGAQISEKNMELQTALESIREEKKTIERERDEAISASLALKLEAKNFGGAKEMCEKLNQTLEFEIHRLLKERIDMKKSLEEQQKEVDDLKKKYEDSEEMSKEKCNEYKEVAAEELKNATEMLEKYKEMLMRSNTT